jgi:uroporphyrinogen decarboxylase
MAVRMTPRERIERTLRFQETDEVATGEIIQNSGLISLFAGREVKDDWTLPELAAVYRSLEIDVGMLIAPASVPRVENRLGIKYKVTYWSEWVVERPFRDVEGLRDYLKGLILEVKRSEPESLWSYAGKGGIVGQGFRDYRGYFDLLKKEAAPTVPCHIESPVGLDVIYNIAGWELFAYLLADDPGLVSEVFEVLNLHEAKRVHLVADRGISPLVVVYCDIASNHDVIFSPRYLGEEFLPRLKRLVDAWHEHGIAVIFHSEGNIRKVMDGLVASGIDGVNPLEPDNVSLEYARTRYPRLVLWGGIDDKRLLSFGRPEEVEESVRKAIEACGSGGLILGSSGEIHPGAKPENAVALFKAAKNHRRNP